MPRRNPLQVAIEDAVLDVTADEVRATERLARHEARRRDADAEAAAVLADPWRLCGSAWKRSRSRSVAFGGFTNARPTRARGG
jgi:hypothetical protein